MSAKEIINEIVGLDNKISDLMDRFEDLPIGERITALSVMCDEARKSTGPEDRVPMLLVRATDMVCTLEKDAALILAKGLDHPNMDIRQLSGEALLAICDGVVAEILPAVDNALEAGGHAAQEMPFILALMDDPEVYEPIVRFLDLDDTDAVVAAIEALAELGDPDAIPALSKLVDDKRAVTIEGEDDEDLHDWTVGKLAQEAVEMIGVEEE
jgi:HEAT repeat protein